MTRKEKLLFNSASSLLYQIVTVICGFILPKYFLSYYGSAANGLVSSITQFLGFISLCECGVGAVIQSTLYKPLADKNNIEISKIVISSERFFRKIAYILLAYTAALIVFYPMITLDSFDYIYTASLILVISISSFAQYYFGMTYKLVLNADQLGFIQLSIHSLTLILNTICSIVLMSLGVSIQGVKLAASLIFLLQPIIMTLVVNKKYNFDRSIILQEEPIKQKWNGIAQHISAVVLGNTGTFVLTFFSSLENVSVYAVYNLIVIGVKQIIVSLTSGVQAMFGNMLAKNETRVLENAFQMFEWLIHTVVTFVFLLTAFLILPFVEIYTNGVTDANYILPGFACLMVIAQGAYCLRLPYNIMVLAAGHYKQTQNSALLEALINIVVSICFVFRFGLIGVALGTLFAMIYRTIYLVCYLSKNIIRRKLHHFVKHILIDGVIVVLFTFCIHLGSDFFVLENTTYVSWVVLALKMALPGIIISLAVNLLFYFKEIKQSISFIKQKSF